MRQFLATWIASASLTLGNNVTSPFVHKIKKRNSLVSPKTGGLGSWFFSTKEDEDDQGENTVRKWIRVFWLDLLRHLRICVLNPPRSTERREVGLAALEALRQLMTTVTSRGQAGESSQYVMFERENPIISLSHVMISIAST